MLKKIDKPSCIFRTVSSRMMFTHPMFLRAGFLKIAHQISNNKYPQPANLEKYADTYFPNKRAALSNLSSCLLYKTSDKPPFKFLCVFMAPSLH